MYYLLVQSFLHHFLYNSHWLCHTSCLNNFCDILYHIVTHNILEDIHLENTEKGRQKHGGIIFLLRCICLCVCVCVCMCVGVCVCVCVCLSLNKCRSNRYKDFDAVLNNSCLPQRLRSYWDWWLWVKGQGHSNVTSIFFLHNPLLTSLLWISAL